MLSVEILEIIKNHFSLIKISGSKFRAKDGQFDVQMFHIVSVTRLLTWRRLRVQRLSIYKLRVQEERACLGTNAIDQRFYSVQDNAER